MRALFLDRDGVINRDFGYVHEKTAIEWIDNIFTLLREANDLGLLAVIVTNQSGIGRGYYTEQDFETLMEWMSAEVCSNGGRIDAVYHCPAVPEGPGSERRKPSPAMLFEAAKDLSIDLSMSLFVGDQMSDIVAGRSAGVGYVKQFGTELRDHLETVNWMRHVLLSSPEDCQSERLSK